MIFTAYFLYKLIHNAYLDIKIWKLNRNLKRNDLREREELIVLINANLKPIFRIYRNEDPPLSNLIRMYINSKRKRFTQIRRTRHLYIKMLKDDFLESMYIIK